MSIYILTDNLFFPPPYLTDKSGILAIGGDLSPERLLLAYSSGIFPWFNEDEPILWWSPDPRFVLFPNNLIISKSMRKIIKKNIFNIRFDTSFREVITMCGKVRTDNNQGTWITEDMLEAYCHLHNLGYAHSVETYFNNKLVGGLYGVSLGKCFFGESMFSIMSNASKIALVNLIDFSIKNKFLLIDSQVHTKHLENFGAINISRNEYLKLLKEGLGFETLKGKWEN